MDRIQNWHEKKKDGTTNYTIVAMASLVQLKDETEKISRNGWAFIMMQIMSIIKHI